MNETLGTIIRRLRIERGYTQEDLAELLFVSPQTVSKWENGTNCPDISLIVPIANTLGVTTDTLFGLTSSTDEVVRSVSLRADSLWRSGDYFGTYKYLREELRLRPNCPPLLLMCLEYGRRMAINNPDYADCYDPEHAPEIYRECIKMANTFFEHAKDIDGLLSAHVAMVTLYASHGRFDDAEEHARQFPQRADLTIHSMMADIAQFKNDSDAAAENLQIDFSFKFESILDATVRLASSLFSLKRYTDALAVCRFSLGLVGQAFEGAPVVLRFWERDQGNFYIIAAKCHLALNDKAAAIACLKEYTQREAALENLKEPPQFESALFGRRIELFCHPEMMYAQGRREQLIKALSDSAFDTIREEVEKRYSGA